MRKKDIFEENKELQSSLFLKSLIDIAKSGNCPELLATVKKYNYAWVIRKNARNRLLCTEVRGNMCRN